MGLPQIYIDNIKAVYRNPSFVVCSDTGTSSERRQRSGVRQGCPLSPYLFIITLHVIFYDLEMKLHDKGVLNRVNTAIDQLWDLEYADDTILFGRSWSLLQAALTGLQDESELYGLFLNLSKSAAIAYEQHQTKRGHERHLQLKHGQYVKSTEKELYLGGQIRTDYNTSYEVGRRIALGEAAYRDMKRIFLDRKLSVYRKLQIYHACIASTVLHGLETLNITLRNIKRLEVFEHRTIRRILRIPASMISHVSKEQVMLQSQITQFLPKHVII